MSAPCAYTVKMSTTFYLCEWVRYTYNIIGTTIGSCRVNMYTGLVIGSLGIQSSRTKCKRTSFGLRTIIIIFILYFIDLTQ